MVATFDATGELEDASPDLTLQDSFFIRTNFVLERVRLKEILWVQADGNYTCIVTSEKKYMVRLSMRKVFSRLPASDFIKIHKTYVVQANFIEKVDTREMVVTVGNTSLPLGKIHKDRLLELLDII
jgi:DNA-binding LytR/AlgR family response regulator